MPAVRDLLRQRFGRLLVISFSHLGQKGNAHWRVRCDCGNEKIVRGDHLRSGRTSSCGCLVRDNPNQLRHGHAVGLRKGLRQSPTYGSWQAMILRCEHPRQKAFAYCGGRGVTVCKDWRNSFEKFLADMGPRPAGKTLDRWPDPAGNYEKDNCRWATPSEQRLNRR